MQLNNNFSLVFRDWLNTNKITDEVVSEFNISFDKDIVIPVCDADGNFLFNKYRRSPLSNMGPKYRYDAGGKVSLYAWHKAKKHDKILITEGEKDCLVAWSHNIPSVTSTGGALSFQSEWFGLLEKKDDITICFDNDRTGADGMVRALQILPWAKIVFIPDMPNVKDVSDYVNMGGNLHELLKTARTFESLEDVMEDQLRRVAMFQSVFFHEAYIKTHTRVAPVYAEKRTFSPDRVTNAKAYPIPSLMMFQKHKARCPFHSDKTASLHYYKETNSCYCFGGCGKAYDAIDIYCQKNGVSFKEAVDELNKLS